MAISSYVLTQLAQELDRPFFRWLVKRDDGNKRVRYLTCWQLLLVLLWSHFTSRRSLRDIEASLHSHRDKLYRLGIAKMVARSTLAEALERRPVSVFRDMADRMMKLASDITPRDEALLMLQKTYEVDGFFATDSSIFDLKAEQFPWAEGSGRNGPGIKLHVMLDLLRQVPTLALITGMEGCDQSFMDLFPYHRGCFYMFDRIYTKTTAWRHIDQAGAYFILRLKRRIKYRVLSAVSTPANERILADERVRLSSRWGAKGYDRDLRIVTYRIDEDGTTERFVTNNFDVDAYVIPYLYKRRWDIELFFKWIKQHLHITRFYGQSAGAVMIQLYVGIIAVCLLAIIADKYKFKGSLYTLSRILSTSLTERRPLAEILARSLPQTMKTASQAHSADLYSASLFSAEELTKCYLE